VTTREMLWEGRVEPMGVGEAAVGAFLRQADRPGELVIWWVEAALDGVADLLVSRELTTDNPVRVRPGQWLAFDGGWFRIGRAL